MLVYVFYGIFILACVIMIVAVLLQPGKADAGALFTSSISSTAFGPRGTQSVLAKITVGAAAVFMLVALILSMGVIGPRSVMEGAGGATPPAEPPPAASPAAPQQESGATTTVTEPGTAASPSADATPQAPASPENK